MAGLYLLECARQGAACAWVAPIYINSRPLWRFCETIIDPRLAQIHKAEREIEFPSGGRIGIYSAEKDVGIRGEAFDVVVVDEAAQCKEETYTDVLLPTLADRNGRIILISTPKGRNWFFVEFNKAQQTGAAYHAPSSANPRPNIQRAAQLARERVPEHTYRQEWLAEFVEDGAYFVNVAECATAQAQVLLIPHHVYTIGVDWARSSDGDFTVFSVIDATAQQQAAQIRLQGQPFDLQLAQLRGLWERFGQPQVIAEYNSLGAPLVERLQAEGMNVNAFTTTAATKHQIMTGLHLAFDRKELAILNDTALVGELQAFEMKERAGLPSYSAPSGMHDDTVMALALAWHGASSHHDLRAGDNPLSDYRG